jgi:hypothetical protein
LFTPFLLVSWMCLHPLVLPLFDFSMHRLITDLISCYSRCDWKIHSRLYGMSIQIKFESILCVLCSGELYQSTYCAELVMD